MKYWWWKILGALIFIYVIIAGMLTPLKPGIIYTSPKIANCGDNITLEVTGYNARFDKANSLRAWLKISDDKVISATDIEVIDNSDLRLPFVIPQGFSTQKEIEQATLIINTDNDGSLLLPNAIMLKGASEVNDLNWQKFEIASLSTLDQFRFPFRNVLNETIRNTFFHVAIWFAMFVLLITSLVYSIRFLVSKNHDFDLKASSYTTVAIVFGLVGVLTGMVWARFTWGAYWTGDVKLNMSAIAMLIYMAYWILRGSVEDVDTKARLSSVYNIFAFAMMIPLIFIIPRMTDSLHPGNGGNPALGGEDLDNSLRMIFYPSIIALILLGVWISNLTYRQKMLRDKILSK